MVKAIVGGNWGDEGKGKITDFLAEDADIVVRFQGGANAGHTIINEYGRFALHILPSGVFRQKVANVIAQGVALDLGKLFSEYDALVTNGVPAPQLYVSDRAQLVLPYHVLFDELEETRLGKNSYGSTKSGIAPFYSDKYMKIGIQVCEIFDDEILRARLEKVCSIKNVTLESLYHHESLSVQTMYDYVVSFRERLAPMTIDVAKFLNDAIRADKNILLEGQLGTLKDTDNGIYPFVTSSSPLAGFASVGAGIPPHAIKKIYTVVKAYSSAVGAGAFVSEIFGDEAEELRKRGGDKGEYGATTGRPRRVGYLDCVASRYGCMLQGTTDVVFSLLDVLGYLDEIPVVTSYLCDGREITDFPTTPTLNKCQPVVTRLKGWKSDIREIRRYDDLPQEARDYVDFVERQLGYPITLVSNGPGRDYILRRTPKI